MKPIYFFVFIFLAACSVKLDPELLQPQISLSSASQQYDFQNNMSLGKSKVAQSILEAKKFNKKFSETILKEQLLQKNLLAQDISQARYHIDTYISEIVWSSAGIPNTKYTAKIIYSVYDKKQKIFIFRDTIVIPCTVKNTLLTNLVASMAFDKDNYMNEKVKLCALEENAFHFANFLITH